jgi:transcriptional regulator with XRE-family HTH domain
MRAKLGWKLRRIAAGYRQQDVASSIGISATRYSTLERGDANPAEWELRAIEELLPPLPQTAGAPADSGPTCNQISPPQLAPADRHLPER